MEFLADLLRNLIILFPVCVESVHIASPGIELPIDPADIFFIVHHKRRSYISRPGVIRLHPDHMDLMSRISGQHFSRVLFHIRFRQHKDFLARGDRPCHTLKCLSGLLCAVVPASRTLRPDHDAAPVRFKFPGHAESIRGRECVKFLHVPFPLSVFISNCSVPSHLQEPPPELPFGCMANYGQKSIPIQLRRWDFCFILSPEFFSPAPPVFPFLWVAAAAFRFAWRRTRARSAGRSRRWSRFWRLRRFFFLFFQTDQDDIVPDLTDIVKRDHKIFLAP